MYGTEPAFGGVKVRFRFNKFVLDKGKFKARLVVGLTKMVKDSGARAFEETNELVPVHTGESRGGLNPIAKQLGAKQITVVPAEGALKKGRVNRFTGQKKSPYTAQAEATGPTVTVDNRILFVYTTSAEGFTYGDKHELRNSVSAPFQFAKTFMHRWRIYLKAEIAKRPEIGMRSFSGTQRATYYVE